jgi:ATP adenylyltransferase/5',5'''-P-1,P-4-tetraphosphate phosphorylase II
MVHHESKKKDAQEQDQEQGDPGQSLVAGELGMQHRKLEVLLVWIKVIVRHGLLVY